MAEPTSVLTFEDLIISVAEAAGIAAYLPNPNIAIVPIDEYDFDKCKRVVNAGIAQFIADAPDVGWRWSKRLYELTFAPAYSGMADDGEATSLTDDDIAGTYDDDYFNGFTLKITDGTGEGETATVTDYDGTLGKFTFSALSGGSTPDTTSEYRICRSTSVIDADPARYLLSQDFGFAIGKPSYAASTNHGQKIDWDDEYVIRRLRENSISTGYPSRAAIRPYTHSSNMRRFELIVDPQPTAADTIIFPYEVGFDKLLMEHGIATAGSETTLTDSNRYEADGYFNGWVLKIIYGTGIGQTATITDYASGVFTFTALSGGPTPDDTSRYIVQPAQNLHPAGYRFDTAVKWACLAEAELQFKDMESIGAVQMYNEKFLPKAYQIDARSAPRKISGSQTVRERTWKNVEYN
jgi:hypothetical protein